MPLSSYLLLISPQPSLSPQLITTSHSKIDTLNQYLII
jgi:hypothetical protein